MKCAYLAEIDTTIKFILILHDVFHNFNKKVKIFLDFLFKNMYLLSYMEIKCSKINWKKLENLVVFQCSIWYLMNKMEKYVNKNAAK